MKILDDIKRLLTPAVAQQQQGNVNVFTAGGDVIVDYDTESGESKWRLFKEMCNQPLIATAMRRYVQMGTRPQWSFVPNEADANGDYAKIAEDLLWGSGIDWGNAVKQGLLYRFYGFSLQEWAADKIEGGRIGLTEIELRPQASITDWQAVDGQLMFAKQETQTGVVSIPIIKSLYIVDDLMSNAPEGIGLFANLASYYKRRNALIKQQSIAFRNDLSGIGILKVPYGEIMQKHKADPQNVPHPDKVFAPLINVLKRATKGVGEYIAATMDSAHYEDSSVDGRISGVAKYQLELLKGGAQGLGEVQEVLKYIDYEAAALLGVEGVLLGGDKGSYALSKDKTTAFEASVEAALRHVVGAVRAQILMPLWVLNGLPLEMMPRLTTESVSQIPVDTMAQIMQSLAAAGAVTMPGDEAVNMIRQRCGLPPFDDDLVDFINNNEHINDTDKELDDGL